MKQEPSHFCRYIKSLRHKSNLTLREAAFIFGDISMAEIKGWEAGTGLPHSTQLEKIALVYAVTVGELTEVLNVEKGP